MPRKALSGILSLAIVLSLLVAMPIFANAQEDMVESTEQVVSNWEAACVEAVKEHVISKIPENHKIGGECPHPSIQFEDVISGLWYCEGIRFVLTHGLFNGTSETTFEPNLNITRAMMVTALWRMEGKPNETVNDLFDDVALGTWYTDAVIWAAKNDIVRGYDKDTFGPEDPITREQIGTILYRYAGYKGYDITATDDLSAFSDADGISDWALREMKWAVAKGLIKGVTKTEIQPKGYATRAQVAVIIMRFILNVGGCCCE